MSDSSVFGFSLWEGLEGVRGNARYKEKVGWPVQLWGALAQC